MKRSARVYKAVLAGLVVIGLVLVTGDFSHFAAAQNTPPTDAAKRAEKKGPDFAPYPGQNFPNRVYWGAAHNHTSYSFDSGMFGVTLTPEDLFKFSTGAEVVVDNGVRAKIDRPLDWLSVTDHAEYLGLAEEIRDRQPRSPRRPDGQEVVRDCPGRALRRVSKPPSKPSSASRMASRPSRVTSSRKRPGARATAAAEKFNQPGVFTALHGFEWTSAPDGKNLHRTVIFRDNADRVNQIVPFSAFDSPDPAELWKYMDGYVKKTGGQVLAIPHNGNLSMGIMFTAETFDGKPMDRAYAEARISHEPLMEVTQVKGDGETHPFLSPTDEFADFERWDVDFGKMTRVPNSMLQWQLRPLGAQAGTRAGRQAWRQPLPVRHDRRQRCPCGRDQHEGRQLLRRVFQRIAVGGALENPAR